VTALDACDRAFRRSTDCANARRNLRRNSMRNVQQTRRCVSLREVAGKWSFGRSVLFGSGDSHDEAEQPRTGRRVAPSGAAVLQRKARLCGNARQLPAKTKPMHRLCSPTRPVTASPDGKRLFRTPPTPTSKDARRRSSLRV
jgi:hypothetical protein